MITKKCSKCNLDKIISSFQKQKSSKDGLQGWCCSCKREYVNDWRKNNPDKVKITKMRYREKHRNKLCKKKTEDYLRLKNTQGYKDKYLIRTYGITLQTYNELLHKQGSFCLICKDSTKKLVLDHCHKTGKIRGFLCSSCNRSLGYLNDSIDNLKQAILYLESTRWTQ